MKSQLLHFEYRQCDHGWVLNVFLFLLDDQTPNYILLLVNISDDSFFFRLPFQLSFLSFFHTDILLSSVIFSPPSAIPLFFYLSDTLLDISPSSSVLKKKCLLLYCTDLFACVFRFFYAMPFPSFPILFVLKFIPYSHAYLIAILSNEINQVSSLYLYISLVQCRYSASNLTWQTIIMTSLRIPLLHITVAYVRSSLLYRYLLYSAHSNSNLHSKSY